MKQKTRHYYKKPRIRINVIKINFFSSVKFNFPDGDLLARYCGQCSGPLGCADCFVGPGCDVKSC